MIVTALGRSRGNRLAAARMLGIGKTTLYRKLQQDKHLEVNIKSDIPS